MKDALACLLFDRQIAPKISQRSDQRRRKYDLGFIHFFNDLIFDRLLWSGCFRASCYFMQKASVQFYVQFYLSFTASMQHKPTTLHSDLSSNIHGCKNVMACGKIGSNTVSCLFFQKNIKDLKKSKIFYMSLTIRQLFR